MIKEHKGRLEAAKKELVDGGYSGENFACQVKEHMQGAEMEVVKRSEMHTFKIVPKRWVVEKSFSWLEKCRRLWKNSVKES